MPDTSDSPHHLFIVRIWSDPGLPMPEVKRGLIEHVPTGERRYFLEFGDLQAFILNRLATPVGADKQDATT